MERKEERRGRVSSVGEMYDDGGVRGQAVSLGQTKERGSLRAAVLQCRILLSQYPHFLPYLPVTEWHLIQTALLSSRESHALMSQLYSDEIDLTYQSNYITT